MSGAAVPDRLGKYEVRGVLGRGAMGIVYDGWDPGIDRRVAIKTVRLAEADDEEGTEGLARFKREAQAAGRLHHPGIVAVFDYGETDDLAFIVMEFVAGSSLKEAVAGDKRMAPADAVRVMREVLAGLQYSHERGVVHRDMKPANIMLTTAGQAKIADFGIARIESSSMTQAGTVMGTPAYMSPEQFMGQVVDHRTDIYSCGVVLYQLLAGERPFDGGMASIMHKAMTTTPPPPSALAVTSPRELDAVVAKAMARRPEDRFQTAAAFAEALAAPVPASGRDIPGSDAEDGAFSDADATVMAPRAVPAQAGNDLSRRSAVVASAPDAPAPAKRNRTPLVAGAVVGALVVAGVATWLLLPGAQPPTTPAALPRTADASPQPPRTEAVAPPRSVSPPVEPSTAVPPAPALAPPMPVPTPTPATAPVQPSNPADAGPTHASPPVATALAPNNTPEPAPPAALPAPPAPPATPPPNTAAPPQRMASVETAPSPPAPVRTQAGIASALASTLPGVACTLSRASVGTDQVATVAGLAGSGRPAAALRSATDGADPAGVDWQVRSFDGPYCPVLDLLRSAPGASTAGLGLQQDGGAVPLQDNQLIALHATMPNFAGYLHLAYVQHNATVSALVPGPDYPSQTYPARTSIPLGQPHRGSQGWRVGPPFGTDMVVAVASTAPLFAKSLPDDQPLADYLAGLGGAMEAVKRRGGTVAVTALVIDTRPDPATPAASQPGR